MAERLSNTGYIAFGKETTAGTAVIPGFFSYLYKESMTTMLNNVEDNPVAGVKHKRITVLPGLRDHTGDIEVYSDPNTLTYLFDMFMTRGSVTGGGPYTWPFTFSNSTNPNSYTIDIALGTDQVVRFFGCGISKIELPMDKNEYHAKATVSALGSFHSRQLASTPTGTNPYTVVLDTTYDPSPTTGLVVGDLIQFYHAPSTLTNATVATITNGTTFTTTTNVTTFVSGDQITLRPQTATYSLLTPLLWSGTEFRSATTAAGALTAAQTRLEQGSAWTLMHEFENAKGSPRSGAYDPAALIRTQDDGTLKTKRFFDTPDDMLLWENITKRAFVVRHFNPYNGAGTQYEARVTFNNMRLNAGLKPQVESAKILYSEEDWIPVYDSGDAQAIGVTILNNLSTI